MPALSGAVTVTAVYAGPSAQVWFAGGERVGYDLKARAIVAAEDAPLRILLRREGDAGGDGRRHQLRRSLARTG